MSPQKTPYTVAGIRPQVLPMASPQSTNGRSARTGMYTVPSASPVGFF